MNAVSELIRTEADGSLSFGDYTLEAKAKLDNFTHDGNVYKVKTFREITRLEKNGVFAYESVPGTAVTGVRFTDDGVSFSVEGPEDAELTVGLSDETTYEVKIGDADAQTITTKLGGKLTVSVELGGAPVTVSIRRA